MILNAYAVLDAFLSLVRLLVGLLVIGVGISAWRMRRLELIPERRKALEDRGALLFLLAFLLLGLNLAAWPLLYLLLQSYVPEWPGVMCIYGVTQVGTGSLGASRFLPALVTTLQVMKPALVFGSGAWFVLYVVNRQTASAPLLRRTLVALVTLGVLAEVDALAELAYLAIPKKEEFLSAGCCTAGFDPWVRSARFLPESLLREHDRPWLAAAYFGGHLGLVLALVGYTHWLRRHRTLPWLAPLCLGAVLAVPVSAVFLVEIAAPRLLHLPDHHCPYDLIPQVPGAVLGIALFLWGSFAVGWACVAGWWARCPETEPFLPATVGKLLVMGLWSFLGSLVIMALELLRAGAGAGHTG
jgi:hypothetical protein